MPSRKVTIPMTTRLVPLESFQVVQFNIFVEERMIKQAHSFLESSFAMIAKDIINPYNEVLESVVSKVIFLRQVYSVAFGGV